MAQGRIYMTQKRIQKKKKQPAPVLKTTIVHDLLLEYKSYFEANITPPIKQDYIPPKEVHTPAIRKQNYTEVRTSAKDSAFTYASTIEERKEQYKKILEEQDKKILEERLKKDKEISEKKEKWEQKRKECERELKDIEELKIKLTEERKEQDKRILEERKKQDGMSTCVSCFNYKKMVSPCFHMCHTCKQTKGCLLCNMFPEEVIEFEFKVPSRWKKPKSVPCLPLVNKV